MISFHSKAQECTSGLVRVGVEENGNVDGVAYFFFRNGIGLDQTITWRMERRTDEHPVQESKIRWSVWPVCALLG